MSDIHDGLVDDAPEEKLILFSVGHRCTSASLIKEMKQKYETYPFDWVVSKLDVIVHCMETDFEEFLRVENYEAQESETFNVCDGEKTHVCNESIVYNKFYETQSDLMAANTIGTYGMKLAMTHHDPRNEVGHPYFERCVARYKKVLSLSQRKYYLYTHPIMGSDEFQKQTQTLQNYFNAFTEYFKTKTENSFGIYFVVVKDDERKGEVSTIIETQDYIVYALYTNSALIDAGAVFSGDFHTEQYKALIAIESIIEKTRSISSSSQATIEC